MISNARAVLGAGILIVATTAISAIVLSKWDLFPPKDYEDCALSAAKNAKSKDALSVLLSICSSEFKGRRKAGGGYAYYDPRQHRSFDIKGPNPTPDELKDMQEQYFVYLDAQAQVATEEEESKRKAEQAAQEARTKAEQAAQDAKARDQRAAQANSTILQNRKSAAIAAIHVVPSGFKCSLASICDVYLDMKVEVTNSSKEALSSVSFGLAFVPTNDACPSSYAERHILHVKISPGETRADSIDDIDAALSKRRVCIKVLDVEFVDATPTQNQLDRCGGAGGISSDLRIGECTTLIQLGTGSGQSLVWAYNNRGIAYRTKGDNDRAIADYNEAIRLDPKYAAAYNNRGIAYGAKGDPDHAIADYSQAIMLNPKYVNAYIGRGHIYHTKGDLDHAIADYDQAITLDPTRSTTYRSRGLANFYVGALSKAIADLNQTSALNPKDAYAALWLDIVGQRSGIPSRLSQAISTIDMTAWPAPAIRMFLGEISPAAVLTAADDPDATKKSGQICEANFYSGEWALWKGAKGEAARLFRLAASYCPKTFDEWDAANNELKAFGKIP